MIATLTIQSVSAQTDTELKLKDPIPVPATSTQQPAAAGAALPATGTEPMPQPTSTAVPLTGSGASFPEPSGIAPGGPAIVDPSFPVISPAQLISPPAVPPKLPPSYYDSKSKPELVPKIKPGEQPTLGPRLQPTEPLKASIIKTDLTARAGELSGQLPSGRKLNVTVILLAVRNNTNQSIIVDGEQAIISSSGAPLHALPERTVVSRTHPFLTTGQKFALAGITFVTLGLATVIAGEMMTNQTSPSARFGVYETMRRIEDVRFGNRVVLPGEESRGLVFFDQSVAPTGNMSIPVSAYPSNESRGRLSVQILGTAKLQ